ncbi:ALG-2 interacting protein X [Mitosporidium daphniae]|uniref:BRO domain-containing protein 1 n=1 Tax=Mitosporidium daphniae TaxID=1485682 RepID=A0A098VTM0_9MICR|nr:ALG-2 interacting protein X [Mitosporidium daphniae]KGG52312.1 ALG-2 interacting protein X [Mitosporidium daphniae]|eukprot:XP_013238739.1 ALG-2 interacting protein X [Mitosporidium daphniae]
MFSLELKHADLVSLERPLRSFITNYYRDDAEKFSTDIGVLEALRRDAISAFDATTASLQVLSKSKSALSGSMQCQKTGESVAPICRLTFVVSSNAIEFEKAAVLYNCAIAAAGILQHIADKYAGEYAAPECCDLSIKSLCGLYKLMLSLAQECFYKKALQAVSTADYYESAYEDLTIPPLDLCYGETFLERIRAKSLLYFSLAQFYKSQELHETSHYGEEVARLGLSFDLARKAKESVKLFPLEFSDEVLIYLRRVELALKSATKDNSTIYHERVPEYHSLSILPRATLAVSSFPAFLLQSNKAELGLFRSLLPYGIKLLSDMYSKKKQNIISLATSNVNESEESIRWYGAFSFKSSNLNLYEKLYSNPEVLENLEKITKVLFCPHVNGKPWVDYCQIKQVISDEEKEDMLLRQQHKHQWIREPSSNINVSMNLQLDGLFSACQQLDFSMLDIGNAFNQLRDSDLSSLLDSNVQAYSKAGNMLLLQQSKLQAYPLISEIKKLLEERTSLVLKIKSISQEDDLNHELQKLNSRRDQDELIEKSLEKYGDHSSMISTATHKIHVLLSQMKDTEVPSGLGLVQKIDLLQSTYSKLQPLQSTISEKKSVLANLVHQLKMLESEALDFNYSRKLEATELQKYNSALHYRHLSAQNSAVKGQDANVTCKAIGGSQNKDISGSIKPTGSLSSASPKPNDANPPKSFKSTFNPQTSGANQANTGTNVTGQPKAWNPALPICYATPTKTQNKSGNKEREKNVETNSFNNKI